MKNNDLVKLVSVSLKKLALDLRDNWPLLTVIAAETYTKDILDAAEVKYVD